MIEAHGRVCELKAQKGKKIISEEEEKGSSTIAQKSPHGHNRR